MEPTLLDIATQLTPEYTAYLCPGADEGALLAFGDHFGLEQYHPLIRMLAQHNGQSSQVSGGAVLGGEYLSIQRIFDLSNRLIEASTLFEFKDKDGQRVTLNRNSIPFLSFGAAGVLSTMNSETNSMIVCIDFETNSVLPVAGHLNDLGKIMIENQRNGKLKIDVLDREDFVSFGLRYKGKDLLFPEVMLIRLQKGFSF